MKRYEDFAGCTRRALDYTCLATGQVLDAAVRERLLGRYRELPAFPDAVAALTRLKALGTSNWAFSNGLPGDLFALLGHAGIDELLRGAVSVHDVQSFKPDPAVYRHFNLSTGSRPADTWLVSSNPFDVIGARAVGWQAIWVQRNPELVFDPWELQPSHTVTSLAGLEDLLR